MSKPTKGQDGGRTLELVKAAHQSVRRDIAKTPLDELSRVETKLQISIGILEKLEARDAIAPEVPAAGTPTGDK